MVLVDAFHLMEYSVLKYHRGKELFREKLRESFSENSIHKLFKLLQLQEEERLSNQLKHSKEDEDVILTFFEILRYPHLLQSKLNPLFTKVFPVQIPFHTV